MTLGWKLVTPQCTRAARKFYSNKEFYNGLNQMIKLAWKRLLIFFEKFNDSAPVIPNAFI